MSVAPASRYVGQSVQRVEDLRILTGRGRYIDDIKLPRMAHAAFLRSPFAHARILSIDAEAARAFPGVAAVLTGEDLKALTQPIQQMMELPTYERPVFHPLAVGKVLYVGDPVAIVIADSRYEAEDALQAIEVDYDPLDAVVTIAAALDAAGPKLFDDTESNLVYTESRDFGDPDATFAGARVIRRTFRPQRVSQVPMEGRGGVADFNAGTGELTYHASTQAPHTLRLNLARLLRQPADKLRVIAPDVGGGFGQKAGTFREDVAVCAASRELGRPVKWIEDRVENMSSTHAREEEVEVEAAVREDGTIVGLDVKMTLDQGAYPLVMAPSAIFGWVARTMFPGASRLEAMRWNFSVVCTNKAAYGFYRGPWAIESLVREVLTDEVARELGLEVLEVRRRNLITQEQQPAKMVTGPTLEGVTSLESLERAMELVGYESFRDEQRRARKQGRRLGVGFSTYIEAAPGPADYSAAVGFPPIPERAYAKLEADGHLTVISTQAPNGQGHGTTIAQVAASEFGIPLEHVHVRFGDTSDTPYSMIGTGASRAATMASGAAVEATRAVKRKVLELAEEMLEISAHDLEIVDAMVTPKGAPGLAIPLVQVAAASYFMPPPGSEPGLPSIGTYAVGHRGGWSGGTHACVVELDPETGVVKILRYVVVEDCGPCINPAIVDGQVRGGVAQGIGLALLEDAHYDQHGNFLASTFLDYLVPTAMEIPPIEVEHLQGQELDEIPYKGVGEGGTIAAPPAVVNAVRDAAGGLLDELVLPLTPERVLGLLDRAPIA